MNSPRIGSARAPSRTNTRPSPHPAARWAPLVLLPLVLFACTSPSPTPSPDDTATTTRLQLSTLLAGDPTGHARALTPRDFTFPADHGPHPDFRTEWWYLTGNLETPTGRRFGYQFTLFRNAVAPAGTVSEDATSAWATRQLYMAHFALTDVAGERFHAFERFARGAAGLAGAESAPLRVWLEDWQLTGTEAGPPFRLQAAEGDFTLDLELTPSKPLVLQGDAGLSQKGREPGNASYYYAYTRLATRGTVRIDGEALPVDGASWFDREWSTSALEENQSGWDWFALQLDDGSDLMVYQVRRDDGSADPLSSGSFVAADGAKTKLAATDFELDVLDRWTSPTTGADYPSRWRLTLPAQDLELTIEPLLADQELDLTVLYWEGAVEVGGTRLGRPVAGRGYVELAGYPAAATAQPRPRADGTLPPCGPEPNCVSSDATGSHYIAPLALGDDPQAAWRALIAHLEEDGSYEIEEQGPDSVRATARTPILRFTDDVEFRLNPSRGEIGMRSASRIGYSDLGKNRSRLEAVREALRNAGVLAEDAR